MQPPLNISKIIPPRSPRILRRPRLLERLEQQWDKKLVLILGQAAQGKSTLALSYVNASRVPSAWLNLGPEDSEAVNLFYLLVQALQRALPEMDLTPLLTYPTLPAGPREEIPLYRDWLLTLLSQVQVPVQVIFDGLDHLAPQASAFRFLQVLLEVTPPHLHLLMLSREIPPLKVKELQMRQEAHLVRGEELAFTVKETRNFLHQVRQLALPHKLIEQMQQVTEGWIGGLVLLSESLERLPAASRQGFISEFSGEFSAEISGFFEESIFSSRSPETQEFLLKSAILEIVEPDFIKDYLGTDQARDILERLSRKNLFVQPIFDKQRGWLYRYHQLFKEFLLAKFQELLPEQQASAYFRAASLYEQRGDLESAANYYLQAGAIPQAVPVMERAGYDLLEKGKTVELVRWLQNLPEDLVQERPWMLLYHFLTARFTGSMDSLLNLERALSLFQQHQDTRGLLLASAYYMEAFWYQGYTTSAAITVGQAERLLQGVDSQAFPYESSVLWFHVGWVKSLGCNPRAGYRACRKAVMLAAQAGRRHLQISGLIRCQFTLSFVGEYPAAEEIRHQVDGLLATWFSPELQALQLLISGQLRMFRGELEQAESLINSAGELVEKHGLTFMYPVMQGYHFLILGYQGRYAEALEIGSNLMDSATAASVTIHFGLVIWPMLVIHYHQGDFPAARRFAERGRQVLSSGSYRSDFHLSLLKICASLISCHLEEPDSDVERDLQEARQYATVAANYLVLPDVHWALALWRWRQGRMGVATQHIKAGMKIAAQRGSYFSIILSPRDRSRIFTLAIELAVEEVWDCLPPLLAQLSHLVGPDLERLSHHANPKIAAQAWEMRRAIHRQGKPHLVVQTLGGFRLRSQNGTAFAVAWEGHQPKLLLKALVAHGAFNVSKEVLLEDLWPESSPEVTEKNFRVSLHRLRKTLEPNLDKAFGSSYVHTENGVLSLDRELCRVDVDDFLALSEAGGKQEAQGNLSQAIAQYKQALAIYGGDFLAEELYLPWAESRRTKLRSSYLELLERVSQLYERQGSLTRAIDYCKKILQTDPVVESTYRRLMTIYANRGMRSEALRTYAACKKALLKELDTEPDEVTTAIFRKIKESS